MMKRTVRDASAILGLCVFVLCTPWPTMFEQIDDHRPRVLDFVYRNSGDTTVCEAAPGDTVLLKAYFAGEEIRSVSWRVSFNVYVSQYGQDTAMDTAALETVEPVVEESISENTRCFTLKFVIPEDIMKTSASVDNEIGNSIAEMLGYQSFEEMLDRLDDLAHTSPGDREALDPVMYNALSFAGFGVMQILSVPVRIFATVNGVHNTRSDFYVRYNRFFTELPNVYVNRNPQIRFVGVYKIKGDPIPGFRPGDMNPEDTTYCLYLREGYESDVSMLVGNVVMTDTLFIDEGYTYYAAVDTGVLGGVAQLDTGVSIGFDSIVDFQNIFSNSVLNVGPELFYAQWFFEFDSSEAKGVSMQDLMIISDTDPVGLLFPPQDEGITNAVLWVQLYDFYFGERNRPDGSSLNEFKIYFKYSQKYIESIKK